jgi:predicted nucleotidyltransferase
MKRSLKHLPQLKQDELKKIVEAIRKSCKDVEKIVLFGSYARGDYKEKKDLDLFLGKKRVDELAEVILEESDYLFLKLPANYNFSRLDSLGLKWEKYKIRGFYVVCLFANKK